MTELKGKSPFYPGQPVPIELFAGRSQQIDAIQTRGAGQVALGKPMSFFVQGDYGIGKSSIARFSQYAAEAKHSLHPIYAVLGGATTLEDVAVSILQATIRSNAFKAADRGEKIREWLAKYIGKQTIAGLTFNMEALRADAPAIATAFGLLEFLGTTLQRIQGTGASGLFLVLDEVNGITKDPAFAHYLKGLIDANAQSHTPVPLLLMVCGVEERRRDMIAAHPPIDRIFEVVDLPIMTTEEMTDFFKTAFESVSLQITAGALKDLAFYSAGLPKIMHIVGDEAFWANQDGIVDEEDVLKAAVRAATEVGNKFVDQQVYAALRSEDYRSILDKIASKNPTGMSFKRSDVADDLSESEKRKLDNFLQKMKKLHVLRSGDVGGEYLFNVRMVRLFIWLDAQRRRSEQQGPSSVPGAT